MRRRHAGGVRAGRLLSLLLVLQEQGRTTTSVLARRLEVSRRTVLRDLAALNGAGVPIVTTAGPGGGVELLDGWRGTLPGDTGPPGAFPLSAQPLLARALGVRSWSDGAGGLVVTPVPAPGHPVAPGLLRDAATACRERRGLDVAGDGVRGTLWPRRLVLDGGRWWVEDGRTAAGTPLDGIAWWELR
ncbi:hypothetical protein PROP_00771 [Propionicimonas sp. T2.31MG-18]